MKRDKLSQTKEIKFTKVTKESVSAYQIVTIANKRFKLHCQEGRSMVCGFNSNMCVKLILDSGELKNIVDNRQLGLPTSFGYAKDEEEHRVDVKKVFNGFIEHLEELYGDVPSNTARYNKKTITEIGINEDIVSAIIENQHEIKDYNIVVQDIVDNESVVQADLVITSFEDKMSDALILYLVEITSKEHTVDIIEFVSTLCEASNDKINNLLIYGE